MFQRFIIFLLWVIVGAVHGEGQEAKEFSGYDFDMGDLLSLRDRPQRSVKHISLRNSASKFLLAVYKEIADEEILDNHRPHAHGSRFSRSLRNDNFMTEEDRIEIEKCNNIITFSSKKPKLEQITIDQTTLPLTADLLIAFNTNDVPRDFQLVHSALRIYKRRQHSVTSKAEMAEEDQDSDYNITISMYQKFFNRKRGLNDYRILSTINSTAGYEGWLEFNTTRLLGRWLLQNGSALRREVLVSVMRVGDLTEQIAAVDAEEIGLIRPDPDDDATVHLQPFVIGYFNGPELMMKIQKLRFKREVIKQRQQRKADYYMPVAASYQSMQDIYKLPKTCERLNFTLDFKDLQMQNWVIAPKKFEAYFCGGECNFPLGSKMNATNHAIVQTLMHLKQPNLPKPCCVPTVLGSISILHYLNEDSVNLSKYPQSVAKECGCH